jgi:hypothetical protein
MARPSRFSPQVRERAARMVWEHRDAKGKRRPTMIVPDCQAFGDTLAEIRRLPKA